MIEITDVYKNFNSKKVLNGVNLKINKGETKVIIGRSGCGKSVLLKHIVGVLRPDRGRITVEGQDISEVSSKELNSLRMRMAMVFQGGALFDSLNVARMWVLLYTSIPSLAIRKLKNRWKNRSPMWSSMAYKS
ncbi:MAG TPA: ATP-binding cassette domain-containing protein [Candidatus Omnitrophota bacterium]|nr:ATP-binding cassette domain-containing protein [Candidatus Omnitrophota bacterium]